MKALLAALVLAQAAAASPTPAPSPTGAGGAITPGIEASLPEGPLSLDEAVDVALGRAKDLEAALIGLEAAFLAPERLEGAYDWTAFAETGVNRDAAPRTSPFQPKEITTVPLTAGLTRLFPTGTFLDVEAGGSYFNTPFPDLGFPIAQIEDGWNQHVSITATHPIWGSTPQGTLRLQQRRLTEEVAAGAAQAAQGLDRVLAGIHRGFWGWAMAVETLENADEAVKAAEEIRDQVTRRARRGLADERDRLRAAAAVQQAVDQRLGAERAVDQARRALLDAIGTPGAFERAEYDLDQPVPEMPVEQVIREADGASLALRALRNRREAQTYVLALSDEQVKPRLSAVGRLREDALFPNGSAFDDDVGFTTFLGLRLDKTFGNTEANVDRRRARLELRRIDAEIARTREQIRTAAAEQQAAIASARARVEAAQELLRIQQARLREEQRNFNIGRSFLRDLIEARQQVTVARFLLDGARVGLRMAGTERALLTGELTGGWRERLARDYPAYRRVLAGAVAGPSAGNETQIDAPAGAQGKD